jgi:hypothetical protein
MLNRIIEMLKSIDTLFDEDFLRVWPIDGL